MDKPICVCGRTITPQLLNHLNQVLLENPEISNNLMARLLCDHLAWFSPNGAPALASAKVALCKLRNRGHLQAKQRRMPAGRRPHRLRPSGQPLPPLSRPPGQVDKLQGLTLYLIVDHQDPLHGVWNDLIIQQHPNGDAPLVGAQLRYLIGSAHGWLGAVGLGPAAFLLGARDQWIGWSSSARVSHLREVVGLSRLLIRTEVRCAGLVSKVLSMLVERLPGDWEKRYGIKPLLLETFVDRSRFTGRSLSAANWRRIGVSTGQGRLGPKAGAKSLKDIWVYPLHSQARTRLQEQAPPLLTPRPLQESLAAADWVGTELASLELGDTRRKLRAEAILQARWTHPQASFHGSFEGWTDAKGAYGLIESEKAGLTLPVLLAAHSEATQARMAAETVVLLPQDTTSFNFTGLRQTTGLGPLGDKKGRGFFLHSLLSYRVDGTPLGLLHGEAWARSETEETPADKRGRNARSIDEKESLRWLTALRVAAAAALRMPQTQLIGMTDREGDLYEMYDAAEIGPANLHVVLRAKHDRQLEDHTKLWAKMSALPAAGTRTFQLPRRQGQSARQATLEVRYSPITIEAPKVGCKKGWPSLNLWAVYVLEIGAPEGVEPLEWMLLTDLPIDSVAQAWEKAEWYCRRWGIEEWHRVLKTGCNAEGREFKTAEHLQRVLAFDLIVAWRVLACLKLGRTLPDLPASVIYTQDELDVLWAVASKKKANPRHVRPTGL